MYILNFNRNKQQVLGAWWDRAKSNQFYRPRMLLFLFLVLLSMNGETILSLSLFFIVNLSFVLRKRQSE